MINKKNYLIPRLHEKYKFHIIINDFGYEHLVLALAEDGFKIHFVSSKYHRIYKRHPKFDQYAASKSDAHVILIDCLPPHNEIERYVDCRFLPFALIEVQSLNNALFTLKNIIAKL